MRPVIRQLDGDEPRDRISGLRAVSYPELAGVCGEGPYEEMYLWYRHHPLGDRLQRWVSETEEGEIVGHLAALPLYYRVDGQRVVAYTPGDYMVHPDHGFQALSLMRRFFKSVDNCFSCDRVPAVIGAESRLGAEVVGRMQYAVKILNVSRLPVPALAGNRGESGAMVRKRIPNPVKSALNRLLGGLDEKLLKGYGAGYEVEEAKSFDASFDEFFEKVATIMPCVPEKDAAFLSWRYGPGSPQSPVKVLCVRGSQGLLGYAVLKVAPSSREDAYVLDLTVLPGYRRIARALLRETVHYLRREGVSIIRYRFVESPTSARAESLLRLGFYYRKGRSNNLLVKMSDPALHETARDLANWSYTTGDGEATFMLR